MIKNFVSEKEVINLVKKLVGLPSYPGVMNQETEVAKYISHIFEKEGIPSEIIHVIDGRCNILAYLKGTGGGNTLMLTGHLDTVPPYDFHGNPFVVVEREGNLYGRGVVDMKGPLACMIMAMIGIKRSSIHLKGDVIFAGVIDEENCSLGTMDLLKMGIASDAAIVGEPTELDICVAHKGLEWFELHFKGKAVHGGKYKEGINAIKNAAIFINRVEEKLVGKIESRIHQTAGCSTINYGYIKGGTQPSTVAGECILQIDRRWVPGERYEEVIRELQDLIDELGKEDETFSCDLKVMDTSLMENGFIHEAMEIDLDHPIINIISEATKRITGELPKKTGFTAWSDGGLLNGYGGIPTVVFGPGNLESAHSALESMPINQLMPATLIYSNIIIDYCN